MANKLSGSCQCELGKYEVPGGAAVGIGIPTVMGIGGYGDCDHPMGLRGFLPKYEIQRKRFKHVGTCNS